jgi:hypothetical protein
VHGLLYLSSLEPNGCLRPEARPFFISEVRRLSALDPMTPGLGKPILESLIRLVSVLEKEEKFCSFPKGSISFGATLRALEDRLAAMEKKYLGYTP